VRELVRAIANNGFTHLQRMDIGLVISIFSMLAAGTLELARLRSIARHGFYGKHDIVPISIFWQVPQYASTASRASPRCSSSWGSWSSSMTRHPMQLQGNK
jgi:hypothetical protein